MPLGDFFVQLERNLSGLDNQQYSRESLFTNGSTLVGLAQVYMRILGQNPGETFSAIARPEFWDPNYLDEGGNNWGMQAMDSLRCLVDFKRTHSLLAGIKDTVENKKREGHRDLIGIDAGTGSGILAMGLVAAGCSKVYALEINPDTADFSRQFLKECGFENEVEVIQCDATKVSIPRIRNADILVSENLSTGLFNEPQYQIIENLMPYLAPEAKIVPFRSTLYASFGWASWENAGKEELGIAARKLHDRVRVSDLHPYAEITSRYGMVMPHVSGKVEVPILDRSRPVNTLYIATSFQINEGQSPIVLNPDDAEFLGAICAFRLPQGVQLDGDIVNFQADYPVGLPKKLSVVRVDRNSVSLGVSVV